MEQFTSLEIPESGYSAVIFDLDGTLVDSMPAHFAAWCEALSANGAPKDVFPEDVFYSMGGRPTKDIVAELNGEFNLSLDPEVISSAKRKAFLQGLGKVKLNEEVIAFARSLRGKMPLGIATGGSREVVEATLKQLEIGDLFDEVVTADDVVCGKPAPDVFLEAADKLEVEPEQCLVLEDAAPGIMAAQTAGMTVVRVPAPLCLVD
ncbi:HAD family hydrolase [Rubritalea marina]|uniref:HAD family hydrolase n=1 Tax=Rubritalea marina TaxID=361055 RepID=UPI0003636E28|nr:HAD family phosphatase [Rubritalea marina]